MHAKQGQPVPARMLDAHAAFILALVRERPDYQSCAEIAERLAEKSVAVSACPVDDLVFQLIGAGSGFKKNRARKHLEGKSVTVLSFQDTPFYALPGLVRRSTPILTPEKRQNSSR